MELRNFHRGRHQYSDVRPSRWASAHILVYEFSRLFLAFVFCQTKKDLEIRFQTANLHIHMLGLYTSSIALPHADVVTSQQHLPRRYVNTTKPNFMFQCRKTNRVEIVLHKKQIYGYLFTKYTLTLNDK